MKKLLKIVFFIFLMFSSCKNEEKKSNYNQYQIGDFRKELQPHLESLSKEKSLPSKDTIARNYIEKNATKDELAKLLKINNPLLRIISYRTIVNRQEIEYFDLLINHLDDKEKVTFWMADDVVGDFTVSDLMIRKVQYEKVLSTIQKKYLVGKVLLENPYLEVSDWMIYDIEPEEKYYNLIKERAQDEKRFRYLSACFALSKFKKEEDVEFLKNIFLKKINDNYPPLKTVFRSIEAFPHQDFFPLLEVYFEKYIIPKPGKERLGIREEIHFFTKAVASYKNENALEILKHIEQTDFPTPLTRDFIPYNKRYVYKAMFTHYDKIYDDFLQKLEKECGKRELERYASFLESIEEKDW